MRQRVVLLTRYPEPGTTKTRLIPVLGAAGAAALQREMTEHTLRRVGAGAAEVEVRHAGGDRRRMAAWLGADVRLRAQGEGDLGARLRRAFSAGFAEGRDAVVAVGADCPDLGRGDVEDAFRLLGDHDAVLGPAADGGYFLVGVRRAAWAAAAGPLFTGIPWGGTGVLAATLEAARGAGLSVGLLRTLVDVDRPEDLPAWTRARAGPGASARLAIVIPTLDEQERIGPLLAALRGVRDARVVVSDGGSADATAAIAAAAGVAVVGGGRGRAVQMNRGAAAGAEECLLFLHADTMPPPGFDALIREALRDPAVVAGAFRFATDSPRRSLRAIERLANWRARRLGVIFGDQAIFVRRAAFAAVGGFPEQPIMEDHEFLRRVRRLGRVALLDAAAVTSARRWHARGPWRTTFANFVVTWGYRLGVAPGRLAGWYRRLLACRPRSV